jgi:predicted nuclease with TOPRIM domain
MRAEYDFSRGVRGKYARRYAQGANLVLLAPDVAKVFPDSESVNDSLRALAGIIRRRGRSLPAR